MTNLVAWLPFPPQPDESARGLVVRVAECSMMSSTELGRWLDLPSLEKGLEANPDAAAASLGVDPSTLAGMGFGRDGTEPFFGHPVPRQLVERHAMRVCPDCLAALPYHQRIWDHKQIRVCPVHRTLLLERCPACPPGGKGGRITWKRPSVGVGGCGHDLSSQRAEDAGPCTGAAAVFRRCGLFCDGPDLPAEFASLPLQDLLDVLLFLGRMDLVVGERNARGLKPSSMLTDPGILEAGAEVAFGWPRSFDALAARVRAAYGDQNSLTGQYRALHRFIEKCGNAPYAGLLRGAYAGHLASRGDISDGAWPAFLDKPRHVAPTVTKTEARGILRLGQGAFLALKKQSLWTELVPVMPGKHGLQYRRSDVLALRVKLDRLVSPGGVARLLGIGKGKGAQLCDAGLIPVYTWNRHHRKSDGRSVDMADAEALFDRVRAMTASVAPVQPESFAAVLNRVAARRVLCFADIFRCILSGQLRGHVADPGRPGFESLTFEKEAVIQVLDEISSPSRTGKMCLGDVVKALKLPAVAIHGLVAAKLLPEPIRHGGCLFDADAVEGFRSLFISDVELARQKRVTAAEIRTALAAMRVRPAGRVGLPGQGTAVIYRKSELEQ